MTPAELGDLSTNLVWAAATVYTVALVAYTLDLAALAERVPRTRRAVAARPAARPGVAGGTLVADRAPTGTVGTVGTGGTVGTAGAGEARRRSRARGIARSTTALGLVLHVLAVVLRGLAAQRTPWANMYEFTLVGTLVAVVVLAVVLRGRDLPFLGVLVSGFTVLALALGLLVFYIRADGVQPALDSYWLVIHVGVAITSTGVFMVAAAASVLQLLRDSRDHGSAALAGNRWRWLEAVPRPTELEALSFRLNAVGFVLWTFTLIAGAIWAEHAWGRYWGWDPKEVWTFVIWTVYAAYLHARTTRGWGGRRAAWFVVVGFACVIANFTLVNLFFSGLHSYSGLSTGS
ncbi:c-type cytochrome biogenesis protein CcsB [Cellulomonas aerilata]|uniref:C-type cytochrome biogenesis protein CcsB n=1 Tax=Cellulomonas aerilata TaxID=515326 RepID=A0A512D8P7_9CELL|nr:c-type cytochrome biogenesis protein CcsB [Cellulomonas aerilata]GEO32777.1 c-type cytochrome biogenesis protein CcsB [Cellulomonas aerilata]